MTELICRIFIKNKEPSDPKTREAYGTLAGAVGILLNFLLCATCECNHRCDDYKKWIKYFFHNHLRLKCFPIVFVSTFDCASIETAAQHSFAQDFERFYGRRFIRYPPQVEILLRVISFWYLIPFKTMGCLW